ncbi:MAG: DNA polymerase II large subunit, partial [Promethearchaeota archaeon]
MLEMSNGMKKYFENLQNQVNECYDIAEKAREKGLDPEIYVESPQAKDLAGRVEKLVGPEGVAEVIRKLKNKGISDDEITFQVVSDILEGKIGDIVSLDDRVERAIRVGLAIKTMGVVSAPLEGISKIKIRKDQQGNEYLSLYFAGPIRAAGGTTAALCVLIADYVRERTNISKYEATEAEIGRYVEEIKLYDRRVHLQYPSSNDEIRFAVKHLPIEINGDATEREEVSAFRDLPRIETNYIRGGACLVLNDGILLKAPKLLKIAKTMKLKEWDWLSNLKDISFNEVNQEKNLNKSDKEIENQKKEEAIVPNKKYIADIIAGRPVFSYPSTIGGHRIRYGRSRNTGLAAAGIHPITMYLLDNFIAIGTQLRIERPGKSTSTCPVDHIEPPIVKLKNGNVIKVNRIPVAKKLFPKIEKILFLGDILFGFGEFSENNHNLIPSGYVEEWWALELEKAAKENGNSNENIIKYIEDPFRNTPSAEEAIHISKSFNIPLHPKYTDFWGNLELDDILKLREYFLINYDASDDEMKIKNDETIKEILEKAFILHEIKENKIIFSKSMSRIYKEIFDLKNEKHVQIK